MREIKFRAWQKNHKKMGVVPKIEWNNEQIKCVKFDNGINCAPRFNTYGLEDWSLDCLVLMQYTGLKDKNGVEIYERDVVKCQAIFGGKLKRFIGFVTFDVLNCCASIDGVKEYEGKQEFLHRALRLEVIGNIYENPELLKD